MPWIDPGWLDRKTAIAEYRDAQRLKAWNAAPWWRKVWLWLDGDSPRGANHRSDWR
jgi:hypothetical protein